MLTSVSLGTSFTSMYLGGDGGSTSILFVCYIIVLLILYTAKPAYLKSHRRPKKIRDR